MRNGGVEVNSSLPLLELLQKLPQINILLVCPGAVSYEKLENTEEDLNKGLTNLSWIYFPSIHAKPETPILWPPDVKNRLIGKDPEASMKD